MPSTSAKQHNYFALCAHSPDKARKKCPPKKVSAEFLAADAARKGKHGAVKAMLKGG